MDCVQKVPGVLLGPDATKLESELGWRAQDTLETGIEKTVAWYLERRDWWEPLRSGTYRGERLGLIPA